MNYSDRALIFLVLLLRNSSEINSELNLNFGFLQAVFSSLSSYEIFSALEDLSDEKLIEAVVFHEPQKIVETEQKTSFTDVNVIIDEPFIKVPKRRLIENKS